MNPSIAPAASHDTRIDRGTDPRTPADDPGARVPVALWALIAGLGVAILAAAAATTRPEPRMPVAAPDPAAPFAVLPPAA